MQYTGSFGSTTSATCCNFISKGSFESFFVTFFRFLTSGNSFLNVSLGMDTENDVFIF